MKGTVEDQSRYVPTGSSNTWACAPDNTPLLTTEFCTDEGIDGIGSSVKTNLLLVYKAPPDFEIEHELVNQIHYYIRRARCEKSLEWSFMQLNCGYFLSKPTLYGNPLAD